MTEEDNDPSTFSVERVFAATPQRLWRCWVDQREIAQWYSCGSEWSWEFVRWSPNTSATFELILRHEDGTTIDVTGRFLEVVPLQRLVYTWHDKETVTLEFFATGTGTRLVVTHRHVGADRRALVGDGWTSQIEALHRHTAV